MNELPTLSFAAETALGAVTVNLDRLIESRALIQANSGGGKSHLIRSLLEGTHGRIQQLVFDPEGEFATLRERFAFVLAGPGGDLETNVESAEALCGKFLELGFSCVIDLSDLDPDEKREYIRRFSNELMRLRPKPGLWPPVLIVIDELQVFAEEGSKDPCTKAVISLTNRGRKRGYCIVGATLRLSLVSKSIVSELTTLFIGRTRLDNDIKRAVVALEGDRSYANQLPKLQPGQFFVFGPAISDPEKVLLIKTAPVMTTHHKIGSAGLLTPPPPEELKSVLAALVDLPREVEEEEQTVVKLRAEVDRLRAELQRSPIEVKVPVEVRVPVPIEVSVMDEEQEARLRTLVQELRDLLGDGQKILEEVSAKLDGAKVKATDQSADVPDVSSLSVPPAPPIDHPTDVPPAEKPLVETQQRVRSSRPKSSREAVPDMLQRVLDALAEFDKAGVTTVPRKVLAAWVGISPTTKSFKVALSEGKIRAFLGYPREGMLKLTDRGLDMANPTRVLDKAALGQKLLKSLLPSHSLVFKAVLEVYPQDLPWQELASRVSANPNSAGFKRDVDSVVKLGVAQMTKNGVKAVLPEGLQ